MWSFAQNKQNLDRRGRIVYLITNLKDEKNPFSLIANIGKRRDICIKKMNVDYFFMINADSKIEKEMLRKISAKLEEKPKNLCIYKIIHENGVVYPKYPFAYGGIDSLNFCVSSSTAKKVGYPRNAEFYEFNDWRFFVRVFEECGGYYCFINEVFGEYNGNNRYKTISSMSKAEGLNVLDYVFYCLHHNYLLGLIGVVKRVLFRAGVPYKLLFDYKTRE
jgi:hypothetical protein